MAGKADLVNSIVDAAAYAPEVLELDDPEQSAGDPGGLNPAGTLPLDPFGGG